MDKFEKKKKEIKEGRTYAKKIKKYLVRLVELIN